MEMQVQKEEKLFQHVGSYGRGKYFIRLVQPAFYVGIYSIICTRK